MLAREAARRMIAAGAEPVVVSSIEAARRAPGPFTRGMFAFDLPDGSGIVLAAEMLVKGVLGQVDFFIPGGAAENAEAHAPRRMIPGEPPRRVLESSGASPSFA
jgi:hypothetical protein